MEEIADFHRTLRAMGQINPFVIRNLLTGDKELSNLFQSPQELESMMNKKCSWKQSTSVMSLK